MLRLRCTIVFVYVICTSYLNIGIALQRVVSLNYCYIVNSLMLLLQKTRCLDCTARLSSECIQYSYICYMNIISEYRNCSATWLEGTRTTYAMRPRSCCRIANVNGERIQFEGMYKLVFVTYVQVGDGSCIHIIIIFLFRQKNPALRRNILPTLAQRILPPPSLI